MSLEEKIVTTDILEPKPKVNLVKYGILEIAQKRLLDAAEEVMYNAYSPYSKFQVGAALLSREGKIISGANVENSAYGSTICAEAAAISAANSIGIRTFEKVAIIGRHLEYNNTGVTTPCGNCRQILYEFSQVSDKSLEVIMSTSKKDFVVITLIDNLLPLAFGPNDLGINLDNYRDRGIKLN